MEHENLNTKQNPPLQQTAVMPRLSSEQIESIEFMQIGDMFPKRSKKVKVLHPMQNVHGLLKIGKDYYQWVALNGA